MGDPPSDPITVTGCPRSGTRYVQALFGYMSLLASHEMIFRPRGNCDDYLRWRHAGFSQARIEVSWMAWLCFGWFDPGVKVVNLTRQPHKVIDSLAFRNHLLAPDDTRVANIEGTKMHRRIIRQFTTAFEYDTQADKAAAFYLDWTAAIERSAATNGIELYHQQVEKLSTVAGVRRLLVRLGLCRDEHEIEYALKQTPTDTNKGMRLEHNTKIEHPEMKQLFEAYSLPTSLSFGLVPEDGRDRDTILGLLTGSLRERVEARERDYGYTENVPCLQAN